MTFYVEPDALRASADQLSASVEDLSRCESYHGEHKTIPLWGGQGFIHMIENDHQGFADTLHTRLGEAAQLLKQSAERLRAAAALYERTDAEQARRLDETYVNPMRPEPYWRGR